ncbi:2-oxo-4-hydroxy-4-carboxy-5-ureidoimidazoline decarboxylase [Spizellomyces sp. 'palustris']|nr:2-oxo-4-hydroxy-4-carboxy-5-ureidoimidazoline decarboxylase [Spizellomyces sp. 'palustris']
MSIQSPALPAIETLINLSASEFTQCLALLFEAAPPLAQALYASRPFNSYTQLLDKSESIFNSLSPTDKITVINAHPRIGEPKGNLSALSYKEQGYAVGNQEEDPEVMARLRKLNREYEEKFGFRFVVFVNGRSKKEIVPVLESRLYEGTRDGELETGLRNMIAIARDRLRKLSSAGCT